MAKVKKRECPACGKKQLVKNLLTGDLECLKCGYVNRKENELGK
jgi:transcription initiation factor TFIIIB Brf1 subunit/transcription initiation factor TFIIB